MTNVTSMTNMTKISFQIRQGDVFLESVDDVPPDAVPVSPDIDRGHVIAEGEMTGHAHRVPARYAGNAVVYRTEADARYLRVTASAPLRHEEHKTVCAICPEAQPGEPLPIATHRRVDRYAAEDYRCPAHLVDAGEVVALAELGVTDLPPMRFLVILHEEYMDGELPRQVAD